ncbi:hypothetical protein [Bacillus sp. FJAT-27251]|uniref:hypothetical protein n=1 Tax=Bacillus sp. FJAT-27251 TaxID=1684142 RepID=UPI0006A78450|nr:hypothetical protein [Bacillus sp. FJAT-27251]
MKILFILSLAVFLYKRYFPVPGIYHTDCNKINTANVKVIDIRDFNVSYNDPVEGAINLPVAYLHRHYAEINGDVLHVVASDTIEKNIGIRILRKKGFRVSGYSIPETKEVLKLR